VIVDTSAMIAILRGEEDAVRYAECLAEAPSLRMAAATWVETAVVVEGRFGPDAAADFDALVARAGIEVVPVTPAMAETARLAWRRFGKGRHPAGLNFGDCFAYALAKERDEPLLFKGVDFARTDVKQAR
jgi:ribonuclease VapC